MENEKKFLEFVGTASKRAGTLAGKVANIGGKIANLASERVSSGKEMLGLADKKVKHVSEKKPDNFNTSILKSDLAKARRKLTKVEKAQSNLESQLKELEVENQSLVAELDQMRSELSEVRSCEGVVRARAAALESELDAAQQRLEQMQNETGNTKTGKRTPIGSKAKLKSELATTLRELEKMRDETKKTKSQFELKLTDMQAEKESLLFELATVRKNTREIADREYALTEQVAAIESELAATQRELANTKNRSEKTQSELTSQLKDLQVEKESLISDMEKARSGANEMISRKKQVNDKAVELESELVVDQQEPAEKQNQAINVHSQLDRQLQSLQTENQSLVSDLEDARKEVNDAGIQADSMNAQIPSLESNIAAFDLGVGTTCDEESGIDVVPGQTEPESYNEDHVGIAVVPVEAKSESLVEVDIAKPDEQIKAGIKEQPPMLLVAEDQRSMPADDDSPQTKRQENSATVPNVEEIKPSIEVAATREEPLKLNVENVEKPDPTLEYEAEINAEEIEPEPIPEVEVAETSEVTVEEVQAADFKNGADKILFTKAVSDFASQEAASRADAAGVIAGIRHELSTRLLITHMAEESSALVRRECVKALATLEMKEGISAIERALADEAASVRLAAVWGLYRLAGTESIQALIPMISDRDASVRRRAITCIGWVCGQIAKADNHHCQQVISALIQCLNDPSESIKNATFDALQAVTGKKMPASRTLPERLAEQWGRWWKAELLE